MVNSIEGTATGWWCANCHITDLEAHDKGLGGWVVTGPSGEKQITGWGKAEGDPPRMVTGGQLTKLGILFTEKGYEKTAEGKARRMQFCAGKIGRQIASAKELRFDEASELINILSEPEPEKPPESSTEADESGSALPPADDSANEADYSGLETDSDGNEPAPAETEAIQQNPDQLDLLADADGGSPT